MRRLVLVLVLLSAMHFLRAQTTRYVYPYATGSGDGTSWTNAYTNLQTAIDASQPGDNLFVAKATYTPASGQSFVMKEGVKIYGGFLGTETSLDLRNMDNRATLLGNGARVIVNSNNGLTAAAVLDGFIVTGGNAMTANVTAGFGGGMLNDNASPSIVNCDFTGNTAIFGGGMCNRASTDLSTTVAPIITDCIFSNNSTTGTAGGGAGMANIFAANPTIINCVFSGNNASGPSNNGGGMSNAYLSSATIVNCIFWNNTATYGGGAMLNYMSSNSTITNCIIGSNTAGATGQGIYNNSATPVIAYSDVQDGLAAGTGNIYADPLFTDAATGNYTLKSGSPCINAGNGAANTTTKDLAGHPRIYGSAIDMGAYEYGTTRSYVDLKATGTGDGSSWINAYNNLQQAINQAYFGDSLFVAKASYQPAAGTGFIMKEGIRIFGGFLGTELAFNQRSLLNRASLVGNGASVISNDGNNLTAAALLDGFIITGGNAVNGGGMYNYMASPTVRNCAFLNNAAANGGGIINNISSPIVYNCSFSANTASNFGGGMFNNNSASPLIYNCLFTKNTAANFGGAMWNFAGSPKMINCSFAGNSASDGGCMYNINASPVLTNAIIWGNTAGAGTAGLQNSSSTPLITYSDLQDGVAGGTGNISTDPLFADITNGDYSLQSTSPCINAGTPDTTGLNIGNTDIAGNARVAGAVVDMGAYESADAPLPVSLVSFAGTLENNIAALEWQTGLEDKFSYFELQQSTDAKIFGPVATFSAKGNNSNYATRISQSQPVAYYRLKMVEKDRFSYSKIVTLSQKSGDRVSVYPNPASDHINIYVANKGSLSIYSIFGVLIKTNQLQLGWNKIDIRDLSAGVYYGKVNGTKIKFIKQ